MFVVLYVAGGIILPLEAMMLNSQHQIFLPLVQVAEVPDQPTIGYATGLDRTLIRWFCTTDCVSQYEVYRSVNDGAAQLVATVGRETNTATAVMILNTTDPRWPNLYEELLDAYQDQMITNMTDLYALLDTNPLVAQKLANEYYPVALINGWGFLDTTITPGATYTYQVVRTIDATSVGSVELNAGQLTPLPAPENVQALSLDPAASDVTHPKTADWGSAQADRRFHQSAYLRWDVGDPAANSYPAAWTIGYDIYRAPADNSEALVQINGEVSVQPIDAAVPDIIDSGVILSDTAIADYQLIDHFYADQTEQPGEYLYRVAPRDALGQIRQWPTDDTQFSAAVPVTTYDFLPPMPPQELRATIPTASYTPVTLRWTMPDPPDDLAGFRIEHTLAFSNTIPPDECTDAATCWLEVATVGADTRQWSDDISTVGRTRWYRLQAVDTAGNRSMYTMPVHVTPHDTQPPSKPRLRVERCQLPPEPTTISQIASEYCLEADGEGTTTRYLIGCTFQPGGEEIFLFEQEAVGGTMPPVNITDYYDPPFPLNDVTCTVRAVDANGTISEPSEPGSIGQWGSEQPPNLPNPIVTDIVTTDIMENDAATVEVRWEMPATPQIASFRLSRELIADNGTVTQIDGIDPLTRIYTDTGLQAGELYRYVVVAELLPGFGERTSAPRLHRVVSDGRRPLARFDLTKLTWDPGVGTTLFWNSCIEDVPIEGPYHYAIFRSIEQDHGYTQITPIFPTVRCEASYRDASAQHDRYFYNVMQFDIRTGEPIGFTDPVQVNDAYIPQPGSNIAVSPNQGLIQSTAYNLGQQIFIPNCTPITPSGNDFTQPLRFGDGYVVDDLDVTVVNESISGSGNLRVFNNNTPVSIPITFTDITVADDENHVCTGSLRVDVIDALGAPIVSTPPDGLTYQVEELVVRPFFAGINTGSGKVRVVLPRSLRAVDENGVESDMVTVAGSELQINSNLTFLFQTDLDQIASHGCAFGDEPILAFNLETLPTVVIPTGGLRMTSTRITASDSCMDYAERYHPDSAGDYPRPAFGNLNAGDSNDGFLRGRYVMEDRRDNLDINPAGLTGEFSSSGTMGYVASYPYGFNLDLSDTKQLNLVASQIISGSLGSGTVTFAYSQSLADVPSQQVTLSFDELTVDARGGLYAVVTADSALAAWMMPNGFWTGLLDSELYLGQVTSDQRPGQLTDGIAQSSLWVPRPNDTVDLGLEQFATLEPGLNLRRADGTLFWQQCPAGTLSLPTIIDSYIRHGGVSERFQVQIDTSFDASIHGYTAAIDAFDLAFLDNFMYDSNIMGNIILPFPADLDLRFTSMWFGSDGCIAGGTLLNEFESLEYWNVNVNIHSAEFREDDTLPTPPPFPNWDRVLHTLGDLELPHLAEPGESAPTLIGVAVGFQPDGNPYETISLVPNRPDVEFDGFPLLLSALRLSELNEAAQWDASATAEAPPTINWSQRGFLEVQGIIAAPYFGALVRESGSLGDYPAIRMQLHEDYIGFDEQLKGARLWVDRPAVRVVHEFSNLVYASSQLEEHGVLIGFDQYDFLPDAGLPALGLNANAQIIRMDVAVMLEPASVNLFLGQSAGVSVFRALAEAAQGANPPLPDNQAMNTWAEQLAMNGAVSAGYRDLSIAVWPMYATFANPNVRITTQVLNEYDQQPDQELPRDTTFGGRSMGSVAAVGVDFQKIRGQVEVDGVGAAMQLEALQVAFEIIVQRDDEPQPVFSAALVNMIISRYGDYILEGVNVQSSLAGNDLALDLTGLYNPMTQMIEAGLGLHKGVNLLHDFEMWNITLREATGALGLGSGFRYAGLHLEASWNFFPLNVGAFGGQILVGTIDPDSPVLNNHFPDVLEHLYLVPAAPGAVASIEVLQGAYVRLYGDITLGDRRIARVLLINGGARFGGWHWSNQDGAAYYGGLAGMFVHSNYFRVVSLRGDITFTYEHTPTVEQLSAQTWLAGGLGWCEPETWTSWGGRWWNDRWCWTAGARGTLTYNETVEDFDADWDFDTE
jgi:hypothetical protein